ncbi:hypothetical protein JR316_0005721 [Psilocybe cubensis]|uniref:Uncharacterized protein n=2 Tax=Psilocybe cubensis TaxID=181762 RepID=A0A8H7Y2K5_PSICU|nr:hypothetical protein JR316_0005721 [Psilocybe cubensis]KAH9481201.1 hypothetical protein JR316_0005721 [Psilocybe cubensis]
MPYMNEFWAYIRVDNQRLCCYGTTLFTKDRMLECWIPSVKGQRFTVNWTSKKSLMHSCGDVTVGGVDIGGVTINQEPEHLPKRRYRGPRGEYDHAEVTHSYKGEELAFEDGAREIRLVISRTRGPSKSIGTHQTIRPITDGEALSEDTPIMRVEIVATFVFKYREYDFLKSKGLIDNLPSFSTIREAWLTVAKNRPVDPQSVKIKESDDQLEERLGTDTMKNRSTASWSKNAKRNFDEMICPTDEELAKEVQSLQIHLECLQQEQGHRERLALRNAQPGAKKLKRFGSPPQFEYPQAAILPQPRSKRSRRRRRLALKKMVKHEETNGGI